MSDERDVHTEHCCSIHGCKYAVPLTPCTVESGEKQQSFPCEECNWEREQGDEKDERIRQLETAIRTHLWGHPPRERASPNINALRDALEGT